MVHQRRLEFISEDSVVTCPNCARENDDQYKYCLGCGTVLPKLEPKPAAVAEVRMIACPHCGSQVPSNFRFCGSCGGPIAAATQPPMSSAPVTQPTAVPNPVPIPVAAPEPAPVVPKSVGYLVVIKPDGSEGARLDLYGGEIRLGRTSGHEALASDPFLSPVHAKLTVSSEKCLVKDLDSLNGVFIRVKGDQELQHNDTIRFGQELVLFQFMNQAQPIVAKANETLTGGAPDTGYWARLSLVSGPEIESRAFVFASDEITIGREVGDVLFRDDGFVSGRHARIAKVDNRAYLKDLGSSNGTYLRIREEHTLEPGDLVLMGQQLFRFVVH